MIWNANFLLCILQGYLEAVFHEKKATEIFKFQQHFELKIFNSTNKDDLIFQLARCNICPQPQIPPKFERIIFCFFFF
jgi:hypothetical protein